MSRFYAGIGSRETPVGILSLMRHMGTALSAMGFINRTGRALGADNAFATGSTNTELYLPWSTYNEELMHAYVGARVVLPTPTAAAIEMAGRFHPNWPACGQGAKKMHGRNNHIILGPKLDVPVEMVICWTPGGMRQGGTGQALRVCEPLNIPIFDLAIEENITILRNWLKI